MSARDHATRADLWSGGDQHPLIAVPSGPQLGRTAPDLPQTRRADGFDRMTAGPLDD